MPEGVSTSDLLQSPLNLLTIHSILINGTVAHAKVTLKGEKMTFTSLLTFLKDASGKWLIISDAPMI